MKNKINKNNIYVIILYLNVFFLNIFVGSTHKQPRVLLESIIIFEGMLYIIWSRIKKEKNIIIKGKIDIAVLVMILSTAIPLFAKTFCSLSDTINIFIMYLTVYSMYIIARNVINTEKKKNIFLTISLISSSIIIIFGMDRLYFNIFKKFYDYTSSAQVNDWRMTSIVGYCNAVFAYIIPFIFVALGKYFCIENKKIASLYVMYIQLAMYAFYFCNSRAGMVIFFIVCIIYCFKLKDVKKVIQTVLIIGSSYVLVVVFDRLNYIYSTALSVFIEIIVTLVISYIIGLILGKIKCNFKFKKYKINVPIVLLLIICIVTVYVAIVKNYSQPLDLKTCDNRIAIYNLKRNEKYNIELNLKTEQDLNVKIKIVQSDNKRNKKNIYEKTLKSKNGSINEKISIKTADMDVDKIGIYFEYNSKDGVILDKIYVNNEERIINYKYLPNSIMRLIQTFNLNNLSVAERLSMYRSGFKLFLQHPICGNGAKTFKNMFEKEREYNYTTEEVHSFYMDILMDYGLIGFLLIISIIIITIYNFIKRKDKNNILKISIFYGWVLIAVHTIFDFDLSYLLTATNFFLFISNLNEEDKNIRRDVKIIDVMMILIMLTAIIYNTLSIPGICLYNQKKYKQALKYFPYSEKNMTKYLESKESRLNNNIDITKDTLKSYLKNEKNKNQYQMIILLYNISVKQINENNISYGIDGIKTIINMINNDEVIAKYDFVNKNKWDSFVNKMKNEIQILSIQYENKELKELNESVQDLN